MKLTILLILVFAVNVSASLYSQSAKLTLHVENETLPEIFKQIEDQSEFRFFYQNEQIQKLEKKSINVNNQNVETILNGLLESTELSYFIEDRHIILFPKNIVSVEESTSQPGKQVNGKITDVDGNPLAGVTVIILGSSSGAVTDIFGNYTLMNVNEDDILSFSFIGYSTQEVTVGDKVTIDVIMLSEAIDIEEAIVVGYGTQKRVNLTGAIGVMTADDLENRPIATTGQGLQGVIPNLNVNFTSGDPNDQNAVDYNIRGFESINGGKPYILIDGVPMDIEDINPNDIESISVLKDASASAIYGGQAAFGVILVTTKSSKNKDKFTIRYSNEFAFSTPIFRGYDMVDNGYDYVYYRNIMQTNDGLDPVFDENEVAGVLAYYENPGTAPEYEIRNNEFYFYGNNDWKKILLNDWAPSYKNNFSISGGSEKSNFFASYGNYYKKGIFKIGNDTYSRNNILIKLEQKVADWISFDEKIAVNVVSGDRMHNYAQQSLSVAAVNQYAPIKPVSFPTGITGFEELGGLYFENLAGYLEDGGRRTSMQIANWLTAGVTISPFRNFRVRNEFSYKYGHSKTNDNVLSIIFADKEGLVEGSENTNLGYTSPTSAYMSMSDSRGYIYNSYAEYELKDLGSHYFKAMAGFNQQYMFWDNLGGKVTQLITNEVDHINAALGEEDVTGSGDLYTLRGGFYRFNYMFKDKYLVEMSGRYDGTSRFPKEDRWGFFPSGSVGWRVSEENFMQDFNFIDNLKIRASYGELGNQNISWDGNDQLHAYLATMGIGTMNHILFDDSGAFASYTTLPDMVSSSLTWETVATTDIGLDFTLFGQRLTGSFDYYIRETSDMLLKKKYPEILGTYPPYENGADLETKGWEFTSYWRDKLSKDIKYGIGFSMWDSKTVITKFDNPTGSFASRTTYYVGQEVGEIWGYETVGLFQTQDQLDNAADQSSISPNFQLGDVEFVDQITVDTDGDGVPDEADGAINLGDQTIENHGDLIRIGNTLPRYSYAINLDFSYKNISLNAFLQGVGKRDYFANPNFREFYACNTGGNVKITDITDTWTTENTDAYWYRASSDGGRKNYSIANDRYLQDASYLRLKSLVLSYSLPMSLIKRVGLSKADVFISGQNIWEISNMIYSRDPEQNTGNNLDSNNFSTNYNGPNHISYPSQRTYSIGVSLTF